jgi:acetoin utilization deacetylase AcuC-like enzyme
MQGVRSSIPKGCHRYEPRRATDDEILKVHTSEHLHLIREFSSHDGQYFVDQNTYITGESFEVAAYAAGASIEAVQRSIDGEHCFALVRPPGHHAEADRAMGFCIFNKAAIAAASALERVGRVAIIDWDVYHGNGTQKIFSEDARVLYCSIHQRNIFPYTGWVDEVGSGTGKGFTINAPLHAKSTLADYRFVFEEVFIPALEKFRPDAVLISSGQNALSDDPKSDMVLFPLDFRTLTGLLRDATRIPLALLLEGGYGSSHGSALSEIFSVFVGARVPARSGDPKLATREMVALLRKIAL